ncbi:MAG: RNA-binding protein, partial [Candidatus Bathyarchaeota archaeon]
VSNYPVEVTIAKIDDKMIVDPSLEEEMATDVQITIAVDKDDNICAMQKSKPGIFTPNDVTEAVRVARMKAKEMRETVLKGIINE